MNQVQVVLVNPANDIESASAEPLGIEYIAAYLRNHGVQTAIVDEILEKHPLKKIAALGPRIVGITATTPVVNRAYEIAAQCRALGIKTVIGGVHAAIYPQEAIKHCDMVVTGDGEEAMLSIARGASTEGIIDSGAIKDIESLPFPARDLVDIEYYFDLVGNRWFFGEGQRTAIIITSRGCPYRCTFCHNYHRKYPVRYNSAGKVIEEIKLIMSTYGIQSIFFIDDDFIGNKRRFFEVADLFEKEHIAIRWACNSRTNHITEDIIARAHAVGCTHISFGLESGSQRVLDTLNKRATVEQNSAAIRICKKCGIKVMGSMMVGNPGETPEDLQLTEKFIKENPIDFIGLCFTTPFPGTGLWDYCKENNLLPSDIDWNDFCANRPKLSFAPNAAMKYDDIVAWYDRLDNLIENKKQKLPLGWAMRVALRSPIKTMQQMYRSRNRLSRYLKRLAFNR
jgi:radical SAM superfamily enzyme YgiQ (UPF0313 family)